MGKTLLAFVLVVVGCGDVTTSPLVLVDAGDAGDVAGELDAGAGGSSGAAGTTGAGGAAGAAAGGSSGAAGTTGAGGAGGTGPAPQMCQTGQTGITPTVCASDCTKATCIANRTATGGGLVPVYGCTINTGGCSVGASSTCVLACP
jgi:hypothetical protein